MLRRLLLFLFLVILFHAGVYFTFFKRDAAELVLAGYKKPTSAEICAEEFKKAINNREFENAAKFFCTGEYAEQLKRGAKAASEFAKAMDNVAYQGEERKLLRDEVKLAMYQLDPFPNVMTIKVLNASADTADAVISLKWPQFEGGRVLPEWKEIRTDFARALVPAIIQYVNGVETMTVKIKKDKGEWRFVFPDDPSMNSRIAILNQKYKNFVNGLNELKDDIRRDSATKENFSQAFREALEKASKE